MFNQNPSQLWMQVKARQADVEREIQKSRPIRAASLGLGVWIWLGKTLQIIAKVLSLPGYIHSEKKIG